MSSKNKAEKRFCIDYQVGVLAEAIKKDAGPTPRLFLDTSSAIDFEREYVQRCKLKDPGANIARWYDLLEREIAPTPIFASEHVYNEMRTHCQCYKVNGHPEISEAHFLVLDAYNQEYVLFLKEFTGVGITIEEAYSLTQFASDRAMADNYKKRTLDKISANDLGLVSTALWALYLTIPHGGPGLQSKVSSSTVISSDFHIVKTIDELAKNNPGIRAVDNRRILHNG